MTIYQFTNAAYNLFNKPQCAKKRKLRKLSLLSIRRKKNNFHIQRVILIYHKLCLTETITDSAEVQLRHKCSTLPTELHVKG